MGFNSGFKGLKYSNYKVDIRYDGKIHIMIHLLACNASHRALWTIVFDKLTVAHSGKKISAPFVESGFSLGCFAGVHHCFAGVHHCFQRAPHRCQGTLPISK